MKYASTFFLMIIASIIGIAMYAYHKEWIVIIPPYATADYETDAAKPVLEHQKITIFFFKHAKWQKEEINVIWSSDIAQNIKTITNNWLILLEDEKIINKDIQVESVSISSSKELFLSLSKNPCDKQSATHTKLMIIHGLLKTIHENKISVQSIRFLMHHQTLTDDHLNFSISWPITGYL